MEIAIIGGGAAGFFTAIRCAEMFPSGRVFILEKTASLLSKVRISGGGRCNLTNASPMKTLVASYPRGGRFLKKAFQGFGPQETMRWFESRGLPLRVEDEDRVFPSSQDASSVVDCLLSEANKLGVRVLLSKEVVGLVSKDERLGIFLKGKSDAYRFFDKVVVTTGGSPQREGLHWLERLGHEVVDPVPSLFSFNMPDEKLTQLMGISIDRVIVSLEGLKLKAEGSLLVTHWGLSGPAILKLSALGARVLKDRDYTFKILVNWVGEVNKELVLEKLSSIAASFPDKRVSNYRPYDLPQRLWDYLLERSGLTEDRCWKHLGKKWMNKLLNVLTNDSYEVSGQTKFKEEFVTCGGVSLDSVHLSSLESKVCKNLFFAGEVLDIDGLTGGFNFQAAWTTGYIAGHLGMLKGKGQE